MMASVYSSYVYKRCAAVTSSHYCSAERQFRYPLEYGGQRPPTAQWTVTGSGAFIVSSIFDDVKSAATAARIDTFIESLPNGYDTILSEGGTNISKGQKQLLTIARAMLLDAKMLILDEATSNVDTRTEIKIQEAMKNLMKDKTSFIIAHRLSTIKNADTILVIKDGEIVEQGNHEELLNKNGFYKELYISQFNN
jgi:ATP-binding cassette subfamily B protein